MVEMDNSQERTFEIGWLVAMIEGEGNISLAWSGKKNNAQLQPRIQITNTDKLVLDKAAEISNKYNIGCYINWRHVGKPKQTGVAMWIGNKRVHAILKLITPYLLGKKERAELLQSYIERRFSFYSSNNKDTRLTQVDKDIFLKMRELNGNKGRVDITLKFEK